jgi:hypothetical protein
MAPQQRKEKKKTTIEKQATSASGTGINAKTKSQVLEKDAEEQQQVMDDFIADDEEEQQQKNKKDGKNDDKNNNKDTEELEVEVMVCEVCRKSFKSEQRYISTRNTYEVED